MDCGHAQMSTDRADQAREPSPLGHSLTMEHHETHAHDRSAPASGVHDARAPGDLLRAEKLSGRHSPRSAGTRLLTASMMLDHLVGLVGPEVAGPPSVWISFVGDDDRVLPVAMPVEDLPTLPDAQTITDISALVCAVVAENFPGARVIVAVVRADGGDHGAHERRWARALWRVADTDGWPVRAMVAIGEGRARVLDRERCL